MIPRKIKHFFELARNIAWQSNHNRQKHGAILASGGRVINAAFNNVHYSRFANRFIKSDRLAETASRHAELCSVLNVSKSLTKGSEVYVVRINKRGDFRYSKPCKMCLSVLRYVGIKVVYYSLNDEGYGKIKL